MDAKKKPVGRSERARPKKRSASQASRASMDPTRIDYFKDIVGTLREPLLVLDKDLRVLVANRSFYKCFKVKQKETLGRPIYELGNRQWDIPGLRTLLETILPQKTAFNDYEVAHEFPTIGRRVMLLNARRIPGPPKDPQMILLACEDVTERKRAEEELKESQRKLKLVQQLAHVGYWESDLIADRITGSEEAHRIFGLQSHVANLSDAQFLEMIHPDDRQLERQVLSEALQGRRFYDVEYRIVRPDGDLRFVHARDEIAYDESGKPIRMFGAVQDITERKRAEDALRKHARELTTIHQAGQRLRSLRIPEQLAREIIAVLEEAISYDYVTVLLVEEGTNQMVPLALSTHGHEAAFAKADKEHETSHALHVGEGIPGWVAQTGESLRLGDVTQNARYYPMHADIRSEMCVPLLLEEAVIGVVNVESGYPDAYEESDQFILATVASQISIAIQNAWLYDRILKELEERKQAEARLKESEYRYRSVFEGVKDAIFVESLDGRILDVNRCACEMYGYSHAEFITKSVSDLVPSKEYVICLDLQDSTTLPNKPIETVNVRANGEQFPIEISFRLEMMAGGKVLLAVGRDITERKRMEEELRQSEEKWRALVMVIPDYIAIHDMEGKYLFLNRYAEGFTEKDVIGHSLYDFVVPESRALFKQMMIAVQKTGQVQYFNFAGPGDRGEMRRYEEFLVPLERPSGEIDILAIARDITDQERVEKALRESEEKYRTFFHTNPDATFISTFDDDKIIAINEGYTRMFGYTEAEVIGKTSFEFGIWVNPAERTLLVNKYKLEGKIENYEVLYRTKAGDILNTLLSTSVIILGGVQYAFSVAKDITERKQAEQTLRESEYRYRAIFNGVEDAIFIETLDGRILDVNRRACEMYGYSHAEFITKSVSDLVPSKEYVIDLDLQDSTTLPNKPIETVNVRANGEQFPIEISFRLEMMAGGKVLLAVGRDITERKRAEQELAQSRLQLRLLSQRLQSVIEEERTFIAREIHDELGQALTALKMDLTWLSRQLPPEKADLKRKTGEMSGMVDGTIQLVRRVAGQLRPGMLDDLGLEAALEWQAGEFQTRTGIPCKLDLPEQITSLSREQATALFRVFQEALTNVARHAHATRVQVALKVMPEGLELLVRDNGIGITQDQLTDPHSLGMIGMRERMQAFGGTMEIKKISRGGTSVKVRMPVLKEA